MSRCRETLRPCRRPNRILAKRFLRLLSPRPCPRPPRREKRSQGLSALKPQGNQLRCPSRRRLQLPERHRLPSNRLVRLCHCQPLLKHRRPSINIARAWAHTVASGLQPDSTRAAGAVTSSTFLSIYKRTAALTAQGRRRCSVRRSPASETAPRAGPGN